MIEGRGRRGRRAAGAAALGAALTLGCSSSTLGPLEELPRDLTLAERTVISSANAFGLDLFRRLAADDRDENVFISPLSAYLALGMTANGAAGETLAEMRAALHQTDLGEDEANVAYRGLLDLFLDLDSDVELRIANSIWYRLGLPVSTPFVERSADVFDAEVAALDFEDPRSVDTINDWVSSRTNGRIQDMISSIRPEDVMFLINAIYFKGQWSQAFDRAETQDRAFERLDGTTVQVPTMRRSDFGVLRHQVRDEFEGAELRYGRGAFAMTILLPPPGVAPADLIAGVDDATWSAWMDGFEETSSIDAVVLPKFRLEWEKKLNADLQAMGMSRAFDAFGADFSRIGESGEDLYITEVKQKSFIEVNEEGTEAAAATSVGVGVTSLPPSFVVDRPFLFAIRERFSGTVLFIGQILDPSHG